MVLVNGIFFLLPLFTNRFGEQKKRMVAGNRYVEKWNEKKYDAKLAKAEEGANKMPLVIIVDESDVKQNADFNRHKPGFIDPNRAFLSPSGGEQQQQSALVELIQRQINSLPESERPPSTCEIKGMKFKLIIHLWSTVLERERRNYAECLEKVLNFWTKLFESDDYQTTVQEICAGMSEGEGNNHSSRASWHCRRRSRGQL